MAHWGTVSILLLHSNGDAAMTHIMFLEKVWIKKNEIQQHTKNFWH